MFIKRAVTLAAVAVIATACGTGATTSSAPPAQSTAPTAAPPSAPASAAASAALTAKDLNVGLVVKTLANPYWVSMQKGAEAEATRLGAKITTQAAGSESAIQEQTDKLTAMAGQNFNCFAVAPINPTNLTNPLKTIAGKGVPIVNVDAAIDQASLQSNNITLLTFIASNNETAGGLAGAQMSKLLGGTGKVGIIGGLAGDPSSAARVKGFTAGATGLTIVDPETVAADWDAAKALAAATTMLTANPDIKGFFAANDGMGLGVQQAVDAKGLTGKVFVMGVDGDPAAFTSILADKYAATVAQSPYAMGVMSVDACLASLLGASGIPTKVDAPTFLITKDNAAAAQTAAPLPPGTYTNPFTALIGQ